VDGVQNIHFPYPSDGRTLTSFEWRPIRYRNVISLHKNPFYAGVYGYGKSDKRTAIVDGRTRKSYGHRKPMESWEVLIKDHHELASLIHCARCGRRLTVAYRGRRRGPPTYRCDRPNLQLGHRRCIVFGAGRVDEAIAAEMLRAVAPMAIEAAQEAELMLKDREKDRRQIAALELKQARYDASLAERRYAACNPDNRLIAAQLEKAWDALQRVESCQQRLNGMLTVNTKQPSPDLTRLADDLAAAWKSPQTTMRTRQRLVRALITEIIADVDETAREVVLVIHWKGGQHRAARRAKLRRQQRVAELRVRKPKSGEHSCRTSEETLAVMRSMAGRWSDQDIAASLNRMGMPTGQARLGRRTVLGRCAACAPSTAIAPLRKMASG
jgi:Recombinase zinc beta ribbon domain